MVYAPDPGGEGEASVREWGCEWGPRTVTVMETKLLLLAIGHFIMAIYFCNPLALLRGEEFCSPYRNKAQTDSRTSLLQLGYPYNYEPLNFFRGAMSMVCCTFAVFEILIFRNSFDDEAAALITWTQISAGCIIFYSGCMLVRWRTFVKSSEAKENEAKVADIKGEQKKASADVRQKALDQEMARGWDDHARLRDSTQGYGQTRTLHVNMQQP